MRVGGSLPNALIAGLRVVQVMANPKVRSCDGHQHANPVPSIGK